MDKLLNELEKQRRAENIYYTRRNINGYLDSQENKEKKNGYRSLFRVLFFINLIIIFFSIQNKEYVFKEEFLNDINILVQNIKKRAGNNSFVYENTIENVVNDFEKNNVVTDNNINLETNVVEENVTNVNENVEKEEIVKEKSDEEKEIEALIGMYQFKKPIDQNGVVTSNFGKRNSDEENVSEYHTGIDIGAPYGTDIKSSVTGIVTLVSNVGDYGKQVRVRNNNVTTLYAHCSEILVKEGDIVADGQVIARVGNSGNSTGPHLHFEIRVDDRCLDPAKLVSF